MELRLEIPRPTKKGVKIRRLFGGKLVIRQVLNVPKAIQDFKEGFQEVKVGFYLFVKI